ncbi:hypothetical protein E0Z10_g1851 [Xylaria hypoxylon]|uniref:DUF3752 domain-containing protein n=1 Tax=Xylaria hypoxylon TaxID=37992 RepID=A0A4Z0ZDW4_9PEZI|nr:hypothetical protein E0Z10_g1851 [Xylaria hypoxylon]
MASIGPTMPPHLAKRKRTPDDEVSTGSPPTKIRASESAQSNKNDIELESDSDSDDGYGPSAPKHTTCPPPIGTTPSAILAGQNLPQKNADEVALNSEDDETIGPSAPLPPTTNTVRRSIGPTLPPTNTNEIPLDNEDEDEDDIGPTPPEPKRIHGPAPPPAPLSERPPVDSDSDSDSDDDYGPALPSSTSHQQRQARALAAAEAAAATAKAPKRDEWMLAPPTAGGYREADPTKLKARRFNSGPRANTEGGNEISSIWTETPEEKRKRLENAVLGRDTGTGPKSTSSNSMRSKPAAKGDAEHVARIQNFTEATRGRSLYEEHQDARSRGGVQSHSKGAGPSKSWVDEEEDDPSKRAFDREKDMKLGGRIGASQRRELVNKATDFGGRFAKGKYL